ncbi:MAG: TIGR03435 family protein [Bryobacteraceae bacterium]
MRFGMLLLMATAGAQGLQFEVASVRVSGLPDQQCFGKTLGPERVHYGCYLVAGVIMDAFGLEAYQYAGLSKAEGISVEIDATMPAGTTKAQMQEMLRNLLAQRLHLKVRRETREGDAYRLTVADPKSQGLRPAMTGNRGVQGSFDQTTGRPSVAGTNATLGDLAAFLATRIKGPVRDETGLAGNFDFNLVSVALNDDGLRPVAAGGEDLLPIPAALRAQLGLRLEKSKGTVEFVVIESIDSKPTEN